jgi:hypothetical protein
VGRHHDVAVGDDEREQDGAVLDLTLADAPYPLERGLHGAHDRGQIRPLARGRLLLEQSQENEENRLAVSIPEHEAA